MKEQPTCRSCKYLEKKKSKSRHDLNMPKCERLSKYGYPIRIFYKRIDNFACTEHETEDGERWITWGKKWVV